jgi:hypothetical protein
MESISLDIMLLSRNPKKRLVDSLAIARKKYAFMIALMLHIPCLVQPYSLVFGFNLDYWLFSAWMLLFFIKSDSMISHFVHEPQCIIVL